MRISDWSSDVCSSDLQPARPDDGKESRPEQGRTAQDHIDHHSSPLFAQQAAASGQKVQSIPARSPPRTSLRSTRRRARVRCPPRHTAPPPAPARRSEEHTSELQSLMRISYAVFCLKNKNTKHIVSIHNKT